MSNDYGPIWGDPYRLRRQGEEPVTRLPTVGPQTERPDESVPREEDR